MTNSLPFSLTVPYSAVCAVASFHMRMRASYATSARIYSARSSIRMWASSTRIRQVRAKAWESKFSVWASHRAASLMLVQLCWDLVFYSALFGGVRGGLFDYADVRIVRDIRSDLFRSLVNQDVGFYDEQKIGRLTLIKAIQNAKGDVLQAKSPHA